MSGRNGTHKTLGEGLAAGIEALKHMSDITDDSIRAAVGDKVYNNIMDNDYSVITIQNLQDIAILARVNLVINFQGAEEDGHDRPT